MPDICMCEGGECTLKETCYRYTAKPNEYHQSYFTTPPYHKNNAIKCIHYYKDWEVNEMKGKKKVAKKNANTKLAGNKSGKAGKKKGK